MSSHSFHSSDSMILDSFSLDDDLQVLADLTIDSTDIPQKSADGSVDIIDPFVLAASKVTFNAEPYMKLLSKTPKATPRDDTAKRTDIHHSLSDMVSYGSNQIDHNAVGNSTPPPYNAIHDSSYCNDEQDVDVFEEIESFKSTVDSILSEYSTAISNPFTSMDSSTTSEHPVHPQKSKRKLIENIVSSERRSVIRPLLRENIPLKSFYNVPYDLVKNFNDGNTQAIAATFYKYIHRRCLFRVNNTVTINEYLGPDSIVSFYSSLLHVYPDSILRLRKIKNMQVDQFQVIQCKFDFVGTEMSYKASKMLFFKDQQNPETKAADLMQLPPERREEQLRYEEQLDAQQRRKKVAVRSMFTLYIDPDSNRSVLNDIAYKIVSFSGA